jgi:hypothetical protein
VYGTVWPELLSESSKKLQTTDTENESEVCDKQSYKDDQSFSYKLFGTIKCSDTVQLH